MLKGLGIIAVLFLGAFPAVPLAADGPATDTAAGAQGPVGPVPVPVRTGKERLSSKASDEQRVDNCKIPPALRGTTPRPDACERKPEAIPTN